MKHLTRKSFEGAFWLGSLKVVIKLFSLVKIVVAARILTPTEIGWFGMIMLPYGLAEVATESGADAYLRVPYGPQEITEAIGELIATVPSRGANLKSRQCRVG